MNYTIGNTLLKLEDISLWFGQKQVLRDINIEVKDIIATGSTTGQVITLLGRSGVGKTQLFKMIAGLSRPTTGRVLIGEAQKPVEPGIVGMVLQTYPLFEHRTLLSNLQLVSKDKEKIKSYLEDFDLFEHKDKYPSELSGGQRQRTAIAQQLLCSEHFILLDEPFSGLDPVATEKLCSIINKVANQDEQNTVIISSHILEPSIAISDEIWILGYAFSTATLVQVKNTTEMTPAKIEGATIRYVEDLATQGLAWNPEIRRDPRFTEMIEKIREIFKTI